MTTPGNDPQAPPVPAGDLVIDDEGLSFHAEDGLVLDVLFDGQRVWSVESDDHPAAADGARRATWPEPMHRFLDGHALVELREHGTDTSHGSCEARFGDGDGRVEFRDASGRPVAMTKWGRLNRPFATTDRAVLEGYLDQVQEVLDVLSGECGLPAFLSFGSLLGAVREGKFIGHDVDVDLGYFSSHSHPTDLMRESFRVERALRARGWAVRRMNGGFLGIDFDQSDGSRRNVDVFTAFRLDGRLFQVHDVSVEAAESAVLPLGSIEFEGRLMPTPAQPEVFLRAAYGPDWRTPNPAFKFETPASVRKRIRGWFGGLRDARDYWGRFYSTNGPRVPKNPSSFATWVCEREEPGRLVEVGSGNGRDTVQFAESGFSVTALDVMPGVTQRRLNRADLPGDPPEVLGCNFDSLREVLATGALLARQPGPHTLYGRFWLSALSDGARENFWRFAAMVLRDGGRCYLEFRTARDSKGPKFFGPNSRRRFLAQDQVMEEARAHGLRVVHREASRGLSPLGKENPHLCRMILEWSR